ncbi:response regulator [Azospirillum halopraeferens]|uniref:response regulator n=1 Tax=Azospirillum halopraeferens TaxID=34010 RepID=UPI000409CC90|nr:response regulator [Azospirillum halopraeferens]
MPPPSALRRILYIDDDPMLQALAGIVLGRRGGFTVEGCRDGAAAVAAALAFAPDLVLLDVNLPGSGGPEILAALRAEPALAGLPVIFVTAGVTPEDARRYTALGAAGVIAKPFDPMTLADRVRALWEEFGKPV